MFPQMRISLAVVHVCWMENNEHCVLKNKIKMDFKDASSKEAEEKMERKGGIKKAKQQRNKKDSKK